MVLAPKAHSLPTTPSIQSGVNSPMVEGAFAPLPPLVNLNGKAWKRDVEKEAAGIIVVIIGASSTPQTTPATIVAQLREQASQWKQQNFNVLTVIPATFKPTIEQINTPEVQSDIELLNLVADDSEETLAKMFLADSRALTVAQIDSAGFLRQVVSVPLNRDFGTILRSVKPLNPVLKLNEQAPDFLMIDSNGRFVNLARYRGQKNVVLTFGGDVKGCSCSSQVLSFKGLEANFAASETSVVAILPNTSEELEKHLATQGISYPMIPDPQSHLASLYDARLGGQTKPKSVIIDEDGIVRAIEDDVKVATHGRDILEKMKKLGLAQKNSSMVSSIAQLPIGALAVGQAAPAFSMTDMNGQARTLADLKGQKNLLLTFFPKCFTGGCQNHLSSIRDRAAQFAAANTEVWAVSIDSHDVQRDFAAMWKFEFPFLPDTGRNLSLLYGAAKNTEQFADRMSVLIDKNGVVRWVDRNVQVGSHGEDVLKKMTELGVN